MLWQRIQDRLAREPEREQYNEADKVWMERTLEFYDHRQWDYSIENNDTEIRTVMLKLLHVLSESLTDLGVRNFFDVTFGSLYSLVSNNCFAGI